MDSKEYVKKQLDELVIKFPYIEAKYDADSENSSHLISITPLSYYQNEEYQQAEDIITMAFMETFPMENIVFISEGSETKLSKVDYKVFGRMYYVNPVSLIPQDLIDTCNLHYASINSGSDIFESLLPNYLNLTNNLLITHVPAMLPYLSGINYRSTYQALVNYGKMANVNTIPACLKIKNTEKGDLTTKAA